MIQMKKRIPRLRVKARITSKVREKDLREKAKMLIDDYELILPDCTEDCGSCPFRKTRARLEKISKYKDDPAKLAGFARRGDKLARAYAATIGIVHEEKTPYLAPATYPGGTITYALRGKTTKEKLIGVQSFDSPKWRVLSVIDLVQKKGLHFYSYDDGFVCTGRYAHPPEEYVKIAAESVGAGRLDGDTYSCPHSPASVNHLKFDWVSAGKKILICEPCAAKSKNVLKKLAEGMAVPKALTEFEISVVRPLKQVGGKGECRNILNKPVDQQLLEDYSNGKLGDKELVEKHMLRVLESLQEVNQRAYARADKCFGDDKDAFVKDITSDETEAAALAGLLSEVAHPVFADAGESVNKLLTRYWSHHGKNALLAVVPEEIATKYYRDDEESSRSPMKVIQQAIRESGHVEATSKIPKYSCLSEHGKFVDEIVRAYKTRGQMEAIAILDGNKSNDHRTRSIAHAFNLALGVTTKGWKYTDEERQYGKHLQQYARALLDTKDSDEHDTAFDDFLRQAGCVEELKRA
jgi:hypothetical protein